MASGNGRITRAFLAGERLRVKSALNPALWICAIVTMPGLFLCVQLAPPPSWLIVLIFLPVVIACLGFLFLLVFDSDKLQSEDFQIRKQSLEMLQQQSDDPAPRLIEAVEMISNPQALPAGDGDA